MQTNDSQHSSLTGARDRSPEIAWAREIARANMPLPVFVLDDGREVCSLCDLLPPDEHSHAR
jgi:hypothetical protein